LHGKKLAFHSVPSGRRWFRFAVLNTQRFPTVVAVFQPLPYTVVAAKTVACQIPPVDDHQWSPGD
jgi:hypothetical protein